MAKKMTPSIDVKLSVTQEHPGDIVAGTLPNGTKVYFKRSSMVVPNPKEPWDVRVAPDSLVPAPGQCGSAYGA